MLQLSINNSQLRSNSTINFELPIIILQYMASYLIGGMHLTFGTNFHPTLRILLTITRSRNIYIVIYSITIDCNNFIIIF